MLMCVYYSSTYYKAACLCSREYKQGSTNKGDLYSREYKCCLFVLPGDLRRAQSTHTTQTARHGAS
jgi:hypothetical protein